MNEVSVVLQSFVFYLTVGFHLGALFLPSLKLIKFLWYMQLNGSTPALAPGLMGIQFDDMSEEMNTNCWSNVSDKFSIQRPFS